MVKGKLFASFEGKDGEWWK